MELAQFFWACLYLERGVKEGTYTCVSFYGSLSFESYGWIPEIYICKFVCRGTLAETWSPTSQLLSLGPDILTRDLKNKLINQIESEIQKNKKIDALFAASSFEQQIFCPAVGGHFLFLHPRRMCCLAFLNSRVEISNPNSKNWVWYCDVVPKRASCPTQLVRGSGNYVCVGCSHEHDGYDPSFMREFHMLVRDSCIRWNGTVCDINWRSSWQDALCLWTGWVGEYDECWLPMLENHMS